MDQQEPQIKFSDDPIEVISKKLDKFFWILFSVGFVFVVTLIIMVITLLVDSFHFNSVTYSEYSQKSESLQIIQKSNEVLLKQIQDLAEQNKKNQELTVELQKQILKK